MGDQHGAAGEVEQRLLERAQRVDVEVVGGLVEEQDVAAAAQQLGEVDAVSLAARELADRLLLVAAAEVEPAHVLARVELAPPELDRVLPAADLLPDRLARDRARPATGRRRRARPCRRAGSLPASGCSSPVISRKSVVLPAPLGPITPDDPRRREREVEVLEQQPVAEALAEAAAPRSRGRRAAGRAGCGSRPGRA